MTVPIGNPELLFLFYLSLIGIVCWSTFFKKNAYLEIITASIFLVVFNLPSLWLLSKIAKNGSLGNAGNSFLLCFVLLFGIGCFVLGSCGIVYSVMGTLKNRVE